MTTTTSHGSPGSGPTVPPLRREVLVDGDPDLAFAVFTEQIGSWWPLGVHSVHGARATVAFNDPGVGGRIVESAAGAADAVWGTVTRWEPGRAVAFTWHPGKEGDSASRVTVTFEPDGDQTRVVLEHTGWEVFGELAAAARDEYDHGWPTVLEGYRARCAAR